MNTQFLKSIHCKVCFVLGQNDVKVWKKCLDCITEYTDVCMLEIKRVSKLTDNSGLIRNTDYTLVNFKATDQYHFACLNISYQFSGRNTHWKHRFDTNNLYVHILADQFCSYLAALQKKKHSCILVLKYVEDIPYLHVLQFDRQQNFIRSSLVPSAINRRRIFYNIQCSDYQMIQFQMNNQTFYNIVMHHALTTGQQVGQHGLTIRRQEDNKVNICWSITSSNGAQMSIDTNTSNYISTYFSDAQQEFRSSYFFTYLHKLLTTLALCKSYDRETPLTFKVNDEGLFISNTTSNTSKRLNKSYQKLQFNLFVINANHVKENPSSLS